MVHRTKPLKRTPLKRKPRKKQPGDNPAYLAWLRTWPCYVCLKKWCERFGADFLGIASDPTRRAMTCGLDFNFACGPTEAAYVGPRGTGQKCPDREAMPLGKAHHLHPTAGGGPESHHALGKKFWEHHHLDRETLITELNELYAKREAGE